MPLAAAGTPEGVIAAAVDPGDANLAVSGQQPMGMAGSLRAFLRRRWHVAVAKVRAEPMQTLSIPLTAAFVGWFTNKLAVDMIFYPLQWRGIPLHVIEGQPFGLIGWQGIVPAKAAVMAARMTDMVTTQLVNVQEVFMRLKPQEIAALLAPEIGPMAKDVAEDLLPHQLAWLPASAGAGLTADQVGRLIELRQRFLVRLVKDLQKNVDSILDLKELVVGEMVADRQILVDLFKKCGKKEFPFLVNSGLWFGFLLGLLQMALWLLCDRAWTIPVGGFIVGIITNAIAIKLIFEPVDPVFFGPFKLQGLFLQRQAEVSAEFAEYFTTNVVNSRNIWRVMLLGSRAPFFFKLLSKHVTPFIKQASYIVGTPVDDDLAKGLAHKVGMRLKDHVHVLDDYTDKTLRLQETMDLKMKMMSSRTFEGVLHPVFQEDEFTLIVAGGALGLAAGLIQMYFSLGDKSGGKAKAPAAAAAASTDSDRSQDPAAPAKQALVSVLRVWTALVRPAVASGKAARIFVAKLLAQVFRACSLKSRSDKKNS
eukprot:TRINITY_DN1682_c0_g1_i3.p1 TRINITY_DN1682_c0_g1~~TRINITY_DN1682_c0_g1_i3.p1  ORF type:complete len:535 (+),score=139.95 TRINITY_DN1682_c0_g1_i3:708-2312(+)